MTKPHVLLKLSGKVTESAADRQRLCHEVAALLAAGYRLTVVHGGGKQLSELALKLGVDQKIVNGRRVTDAETLNLAKMTFVGTINTELVADFVACGVSAIGLSGVSGALIRAKRRAPKSVFDPNTKTNTLVDYGFVGDIESVNGKLINDLQHLHHLPVVASLGVSATGEILNINADTIAEALAIATKPEHVILLSDTGGVFRDFSDPSSLIRTINADEIEALLQSNIITDGMIPKLTSAAAIVRQTGAKVHIGHGFQKGIISAMVFGRAFEGTTIEASPEKSFLSENIVATANLMKPAMERTL